jgi:A/G-specific adenine glycosylase
LRPLLNLKKLYSWYEKNRRDLPFRKAADPYRIWIAEVMLQQTRVAAMLPRYNDFLKVFPDLSSLSQASLQSVLQSWSGLGYYSRARHLHSCARQLMAGGGKFPLARAEMMRLPGIGSYTAAAILSQAFGQPEAAVDGNVRRIFQRHDGITIAQVEQAAQDLLASKNAGEPGMHNQALMELGALVCLPGQPVCQNCPFKSTCRAAASGDYNISKQKVMRDLSLEILFIEYRSRILLYNSNESRFFKNIWFLPLQFNGLYETPAEVKALCAAENVKNIHRHPKKIKHAITNHKITASVSQVSVKRPASGKNWKQVHAHMFLAECVPSLGHKAFRLFQQLQGDIAAS